MVHEAYVSFETAKLLKEKGFDWGTQYVYTEDGAGCTPPKMGKWKAKSNIPMVTHQMACAWLREVHNIFILIGWNPFQKEYFTRIINMTDGIPKRNIHEYTDYNEAVEEFIKYVLENLI